MIFCRSVDDVCIFRFFESVLHRFDAPWVECSRGKSEVCEFDMSSLIDEEVLRDRS